MKAIVVGSGPSGISCAYALVNKGIEVIMLDVGIELEPDKQRIVNELSNTTKDNWDNSLSSFIKDSRNDDLNNVDAVKKLIFGSDFPYKGVESFIKTDFYNTEVLSSFAKGGFSNVWGKSILPYHQNDLKDWPITIKDLEPYYKKVLSFMGLSAVKDSLEDIFPLYCDSYDSLKSSHQSEAMMATF